MVSYQKITEKVSADIRARHGRITYQCGPATELLLERLKEAGVENARHLTGFCSGHAHNWVGVGGLYLDPTAKQFSMINGIVEPGWHCHYDPVPEGWRRMLTRHRRYDQHGAWQRLKPKMQAGCTPYGEWGEDSWEIRENVNGEPYYYRSFKVKLPADGQARTRAVVVHENEKSYGIWATNQRRYWREGTDQFNCPCNQERFVVPKSNGAFLHNSPDHEGLSVRIPNSIPTRSVYTAYKEAVERL